MPQTPLAVSQVRTERIFTSWMPAAVIGSMCHSSIIVPFGTMTPAGLVDQVLGRGAAQDAGGQRGDDLAGIDDRAHADAVVGAAIALVDDEVLRHVDEATRQIARVRGLQRRVGETLAGAVGGVEVLEHVEAFLEVRDDRRLDDLARRLGHQAAHAGELLHLRRRAARAECDIM